MKPVHICFLIVSVYAAFLSGYVYANYNTVNHLAIALDK